MAKMGKAAVLSHYLRTCDSSEAEVVTISKARNLKQSGAAEKVIMITLMSHLPSASHPEKISQSTNSQE